MNALEEQIQTTYQELDSELTQVEEALYLRRQAPGPFLQALGKLVNRCEQKPYANLLQLDIQGTVELCTRLAGLYAHVLTNLTDKLTFNEVFHLTLQKRFMTQVFEVSGYRSSQFARRLLLAKGREKKTREFTDNPGLLRATLLGTVNEVDTEDLVALSLEDSETAAMLCIGLLLDRLPLSVTGEASRNYLLENGTVFNHLRPLEHYAAVVANVWMLCSYASSPQKHEVKKHLNQWFQRLHKAKGIAPKPAGSVAQPGNVDNKPVMAVVAESFTSVHAMYRWYAPIIRELKKDFFMVLVALRGDVDDTSMALFDRYIEVPAGDEMNLQPVLNQCTPDVAYFTSVGMRAWGISIANLRWAPLQVMSFGHPASTHSPHMDVAFINTRTVVDTGVVQENMLVLDSEIGSLIEKHVQLDQVPTAQLASDCVHIAVPCNAMKLNLHFVTALKEIERLAEKPVRFTFFPNEYGVSHLSAERRLKAHFPNALVARRTTYTEYLTLLSHHHMALSPFPFGNATSTIDCLLLGLPVVAWLGEEPHSRSDYDVLAAFELEDYCVATSVDNYVQGAARYINTPELLDELRTLIRSKNFLERHSQDENPLSQEFCKALKWAYANPKAVQNPRGLAYTPDGRW
ncbi:MAG: hypothetical protein ACK4FF_02275 [Limnobacter sp.]|uniref:hypothetical protein n=1 Tax=Limnobacter sp. TaxID=2003368 RepID=UPI00391D850D